LLRHLQLNRRNDNTKVTNFDDIIIFTDRNITISNKNIRKKILELLLKLKMFYKHIITQVTDVRKRKTKYATKQNTYFAAIDT